ncbi:hypothetical protein NL676_002041 [Syzygium grande]|nr:hypothetical protein NL676_002041 [Syzygium grande]
MHPPTPSIPCNLTLNAGSKTWRGERMREARLVSRVRESRHRVGDARNGEEVMEMEERRSRGWAGRSTMRAL